MGNATDILRMQRPYILQLAICDRGSPNSDNAIGSCRNLSQDCLSHENLRSNNMEHKKWKYPTRLPVSIPSSPLWRKAFHRGTTNPTPGRIIAIWLRRFGNLLKTEDIAPSVLTPELAVELGRRLPATPKSQIKILNLARLFVEHLLEIGVATRPPLTIA